MKTAILSVLDRWFVAEMLQKAFHNKKIPKSLEQSEHSITCGHCGGSGKCGHCSSAKYYNVPAVCKECDGQGHIFF